LKIFKEIDMNQDSTGRPQQGGHDNKQGQQGQQPGQGPGQQTQRPSEKPGQQSQQPSEKPGQKS
jgi:hypothetical protein